MDSASQGVGLAPVLEPIVTLADEAVVGFEALARWPALRGPSPLDVFDHAAAAGRVDELDERCARAAIDTARARRLPAGTLLSINCEPRSTCPGSDTIRLVDRERSGLTVMFELTERGLLTHPRDLLAKVRSLRAAGFAIALDDVGAHPDSLALLDVVSPDVIKLDISLVQSRPSRGHSRVLAAVWAHHERTGAIILAEGIENDEHLKHARALGATLGQGHKFREHGHPIRPLCTPDTIHVRRTPLVFASPSDLLSVIEPRRSAPRSTLTAFSRHIERQARHTTDPPMVLTAVPDPRYFTAATQDRYRRLALTSPLVAVFGADLPLEPAGKIREVQLDSSDPVCSQWIVLALGPQFAVALIASERYDDGHRTGDTEQVYEFAITYDRALVTAAARSLMDRLK